MAIIAVNRQGNINYHIFIFIIISFRTTFQGGKYARTDDATAIVD